MAPRFVYRRKVTYNTKSNKIRKVKTPGGRNTIIYLNKKVGFAKCGQPDCNRRLGGIKRMRPADFHRVK